MRFHYSEIDSYTCIFLKWQGGRLAPYINHVNVDKALMERAMTLKNYINKVTIYFNNPVKYH